MRTRKSFIVKGFTLVELLIVIAILAILATLGVTNFQSTRIKARDVGRKSDLQTIAKSLEAYVNDHRAYPLSNSEGEIICKTGNVVCAWDTMFSDDNGTIYTSTLPSDESVSSDYRYTSNGTSYTLYTRLENVNDPSIITLTGILCGSVECNYKVTSSNIQ